MSVIDPFTYVMLNVNRITYYDLLFYFHLTGGNYQGGKQQRGGGGRQPRHQPY